MAGIQWLRSALHITLIYAMMPVFGLVYLPAALHRPAGAVAACKAWARFAIWTARWMVGIRTELRGTPPTGEVLVAAKHQSFLDILMIYASLPRAKFIMKKELTRAPVLGWYALRLGCVAVDRGKRTEAIRKMVTEVQAGRAEPGQLVIYPQGTRIPPGQSAPYKVGAAVLYTELGQSCVPVACNVGVFWPRRGIGRKPGTAIVEFLDPIPPGMTQEAFLETLEEVVETRSNALLAEAKEAT